MARYAIETLSDEKKLNEMAHRAREAARASYCTSKIIPQYEAFYRKVLDRVS
jgi:hypothetical protein